MNYDLQATVKNVANCLRAGAFTREELAEELELVFERTERLKTTCHAMPCAYCRWWLPVPSHETPDSVAAAHAKVCPDGPYVAMQAEHAKEKARLQWAFDDLKKSVDELVIAERGAPKDSEHSGTCAQLELLIEEKKAAAQRLKKRDEEIRKLIDVAHKRGWNGVENPKALWDFFEFLNKEKDAEIAELQAAAATLTPMLLWCPTCHTRHIDEGEFATKAHHTHACQSCGMVWRPAIAPTVGVAFLPGFKNGGGQ